MELVCDAFSIPKYGCSEEEYEDAYKFNEQAKLFAIADGATEASFSKEWANLVVDAYVNKEFVSRVAFNDSIHNLQKIWLKEVSKKPLPWYAEEKLQKGAFCSFLGLQFAKTPSNKMKWQALINGDCCLFQIRGNSLIVALPFNTTEDFNNHPVLLSSKPNVDSPPDSLLKVAKGIAETGDTFFLMTDALACWFLKRVNRKPEKVIEVMRDEMPDSEKFGRLIVQERNEKTEEQLPWLKNDDVTFLRITIN